MLQKAGGDLVRFRLATPPTPPIACCCSETSVRVLAIRSAALTDRRTLAMATTVRHHHVKWSLLSIFYCFYILHLGGSHRVLSFSIALSRFSSLRHGHHRTQVRVASTVDAATVDARPPSPNKQQKLESYTVKELRAMVKQVSLGKRGVLSRLKKKKDLLDYLQLQNQQGQQLSETTQLPPRDLDADDTSEDDTTTTTLLNSSNTTHSIPPSRPNPLVMPPLPPQQQQQHPPSRQELLLQRIDDRYPDAPRGPYDPPVDFRQSHHPLTAARTASSDLDIVFVGTASCMPSATRGVSCTALRINWRRVGCSTWLFDVGESTQVSLYIIMVVVVELLVVCVCVWRERQL